MLNKLMVSLKRMPFGDELLAEIREHVKEISLEKNEVLIPPGSKHEYAYVAKTGSLVKYLTTREGTKVPVWFYFDELFDVALCPDSYHLGKPTKYEVMAMENSVVWRFRKQRVVEWLHKYPEFHEMYVSHIIARSIYAEELRAYQLLHTPLEFISYLDREYPIFRKRVSSRNMAHFIGVSPEWYSKLKRKL